MLRLIGAVIAGIVAWILIVTVLNLGLRYGWPDYAAVEGVMEFTLPMMVARLLMSAIGSIASGYIAAWIGRGGQAPLISGLCLLLLFAPQHYILWTSFPVWYHLTFLASLPLLAWVGGRIWGGGRTVRVLVVEPNR